MITVDKDVPYPARLGEPADRWPLLDMNVGESFWVERKMSSTTAVVRMVGLHSGRVFSCRTERTGVRVWRLS